MFSDAGDDRLHLFANVEVFLIVMAGWILLATNTVVLDDTTDALLSTVLIMIVVGLLLAFVFLAGQVLHKMLARRQHRKSVLAKVNEER